MKQEDLENISSELTAVVAARTIVSITFSLGDFIAFFGIVERGVASLMVTRRWRRWWFR
jgi:hypothetical protein